MQDTVIPCPHCSGTGELRGSWWVVVRWQFGRRDEWGPFSTREEAEKEGERRGHRIFAVEFRREG